ncbi:MAG: tRNA uridine(34) 5-carboxymethylaminomethyl modification radical SAM/GNAT enzyme Elp3 [Patescibacteria group bacterium]|nr:MAG: tRNA uridine(34) 5-carboxymethylaminomethyl modification radical SAM/GNAT enzyme Elp3 [Patescibacteria group bacterium]
MPKSYLFSEPGAQRAHDNKFDPYYQTYNRLVSYEKTGHPISKVELIILGGTWSSYPEAYQVWFVKRCFDAMNDYKSGEYASYLKPKIEMPYDEKKLSRLSGSYNAVVGLSRNEKRHIEETASWEDLFKAHLKNVDARCRCTGLVLETRPDEIDRGEIVRMRRLGATKVQIGVQSLNDKILDMNKRGHNSAKTAEAFALLREAGFKIHAHWMLNLYGATPESDIQDFEKLFGDLAYRPDELKIYPCSLIEGTELMGLFNEKKWRPYTENELIHIFKAILPKVPRYCRITRIVRDISGDDIVAGNKKTNFRQIAEAEIEKAGDLLNEIRYREIRNEKVDVNDLVFKTTEYSTSNTKEYFLEYVTGNDKIAAFLRLSLPLKEGRIEEIKNSAMIREIHVYGESISVGQNAGGRAQHSGLGKMLLRKASAICKDAGFRRLSVISSVGTRGYYSDNGFSLGTLYQHLEL